MSIPIEEQNKLIEQFYFKRLYLSYSALNKFLYSPTTYYNQYVLQLWEERTDSYLIDGKVIHCLLLDNGSFDQQFKLLPGNLPTGNTRTVVDKMYAKYIREDSKTREVKTLASMETDIIEVLKEIGLHQALKTDKQRIEKIVSTETESYWTFLETKGNRDLIDQETYDRCNESVQILKANPTVYNLLGLGLTEFDEGYEVYNELLVSVDTTFNFGIKGIIDNIKIDYFKKTIFINDLKTTGKTITEFQDTVQFYNYWMQAAIYTRLVFGQWFQQLTPDWKVQFTFIVIDKYNQVYPFEVSEATMLSWQEKLEGKLQEFDWHYTNKDYSLPYAFLTGQIIL